MKKILNQQIEHLTKLEELADKGNSFHELNNIELVSMAKDLSDISEKMSTIMSSGKERDIKQAETAKVEEKEKSDKKADDKVNGEKSLKELQKISAALKAQSNVDVAEKALDDPVYHNMFTRLDLLKESFGKLKESFKNKDTGKTTVGSTFKGMTNNVASVFSKNARNRNQYITTERAAGSVKTDKQLKAQYEEKQKLLYLNNKNERNMNEKRGLLSKEEFLKSTSPDAKKYKEEQQRIGGRLSEIDSRYKYTNPQKSDREKDLGFFGETGSMKRPEPKDVPEVENPIATEYTPERETRTNFSTVLNSIKDSIEKLVEKITPLTSSNVGSDIESSIETARATELFQDSQLKSMNDQTSLMDKTLEIQKLILEELKKRTEEVVKKNENKEPPKKPTDTPDINSKRLRRGETTRRPRPTRNNSRKRRGLLGRLGLGAAVAASAAEMSTDNDNTPSLADVVPEERFPNRTPNTPRPTTPEVPKTSTGGGLLDKTKGVFNKIPGGAILKNAGKMALRLAAPVAIAETAYEVGSAAIDAYDESFGEGGKKVVQDLHHKKIISYNFGDSEVLDWKGIEELPTDDLKKLVNAKIRFNPEDDAKLHEVLTHKLITGDIKPETKVTPEAVTPTTETKVTPEAIKPKTTAPEAANVVYDKSAEVSKEAVNTSTVVNNISAPTNNVTQPSTNQQLPMNPRNTESTISKFFQNRNSFY